MKDMLKKLGMNDAKAVSTLMGTDGSLDSHTSGNMVDQKLYRSMIGSLLYVTASRPDVMFSVCMCSRFQASPRESHLKATKRILMYLKHTQNVGLWYPKGAKFELIEYTNSDYKGCNVERRSTSGTCQLFGHPRSKILLHYQSSNQNTLRPVVVVHKSYG